MKDFTVSFIAGFAGSIVAAFYAIVLLSLTRGRHASKSAHAALLTRRRQPRCVIAVRLATPRSPTVLRASRGADQPA